MARLAFDKERVKLELSEHVPVVDTWAIRNLRDAIDCIDALEAEITDIHQGYQTGETYARLVSAQVDALTEKYRAEIAALREPGPCGKP